MAARRKTNIIVSALLCQGTKITLRFPLRGLVKTHHLGLSVPRFGKADQSTGSSCKIIWSGTPDPWKPSYASMNEIINQIGEIRQL